MKNGVLIGALALALAAGHAEAQNALGDGTRLDRNPLRGSGGRNAPRRDYAAELRLRNAIVTGNAPGGLSFRGIVGYNAPEEFRGDLGSDTLFSFRRDSYFSGLAGMGIRGTDALQYQFAMTTGSRPPLARPDTSLLRGGGAATSGQVQAAQRDTSLWGLRSASAYTANRSMEPTLLSVILGPEGKKYGLTASPLRGLAPELLPPERTDSGLIDLTARTGAKPVETGIKPADAPAPETPPDGERPGSPYDEVIERMKKFDQAPTPEGQRAAWEKRLEDLRKELEEAGREGPIVKPPAILPGDKPEVKPGEKPEEKPEEKKEIDQGTIDLLKSAAGEIKRFAPPAGFDAYARHMEAGEKALAEGRFFHAEERFTAALSVRHADAMASVGRIHAQLGASLFVSASMNLRRLLVEHPELAGVKYDASILPDPERARAILVRLEALAGQGGSMSRDAGLLLAYFAHQLGDDAAAEKGLDLTRPPEGEEEDQLSRLGDLLRRVWAD